MNFIQKILAQMSLTKLFDAINGRKTYLLALLNVVVAVMGHYWGPFHLAGGIVPKESWNDVWGVINTSGFIAFFRHGVSKINGVPS